MKKALRALAEACPGEGPVTKCPIIGVTDDYYEVVYDPAKPASRRAARTGRSR
jgi:hypothetical protein